MLFNAAFGDNLLSFTGVWNNVGYNFISIEFKLQVALETVHLTQIWGKQKPKAAEVTEDTSAQ